MPRRDGTGPMGAGSMTGKGLGVCIGANAERDIAGEGMGLDFGKLCRRGIGRGFGRGFVMNDISTKTQKDILDKQKTILEERLKFTEKQLENL
ncbi:MAG: DUF5320 domain-containing protein [Clostridiales bacterium]|nr:DUF5320 domain-containing protein [Clostridiales bacterium]